MKKIVLSMALLLCMASTVFAQKKMGMFNHLSVGVGVGTTGIDIQVATPMSRFAALRAGVNIMPSFSVNQNFNIDNSIIYRTIDDKPYYMVLNEYMTDNNIKADMTPIMEGKMAAKGKWNNVTGNILVDAYPFIKSSFHVTVGMMFGGGNVMTGENSQAGSLMTINAWNQLVNDVDWQWSNYDCRFATAEDELGVKYGNSKATYLKPDALGNVKVTTEVWSVRPYVGLGFGRAVPGKKRLNVSFDLGCYFWGTAKMKWNDEITLDKDNYMESGLKDAMKIVEKITVYPVLNIKLNGRIL